MWVRVCVLAYEHLSPDIVINEMMGERDVMFRGNIITKHNNKAARFLFIMACRTSRLLIWRISLKIEKHSDDDWLFSLEGWTSAFVRFIILELYSWG